MSVTVAPARASGELWGRVRSRAQPILAALPYVAPLIVAAALVVLVPALWGLSRSVFNWQPGSSSPYVGLDNFQLLANSTTFRTILVNEGVYLLGLPIWTILPLLIAVFLFTRVRFAGLIRTLIFLPAVVSPALLGIMFTPILAPSGLVNTTLRSAGVGGVAHAWVDDPTLVKP